MRFASLEFEELILNVSFSNMLLRQKEKRLANQANNAALHRASSCAEKITRLLRKTREPYGFICTPLKARFNMSISNARAKCFPVNLALISFAKVNWNNHTH
jgi:hypothetical protein